MKQISVFAPKQRGISLVEMAIATAVVAALLVGMLMAFPKIQFERQMAAARQEIPVTVNTIYTAYATQLDTTGVTTRILVGTNAWPSERVRDRGLTTESVNGPFAGSSEFVFANTATAIPRLRQVNQGFAYWLTELPPEACLPILQVLAAQRPVVQLFVGAAGSRTPSGNPAIAGVASMNSNGVLTLNMGTAAAACQGPGKKQVAALMTRA